MATPRSDLAVLAKNLKPPLYLGVKGSEDLDTWLFQVEQHFLTLEPISDTNKVRLAGLLLKGQAASWYRDTMQRNHTIQTWAEFVS